MAPPSRAATSPKRGDRDQTPSGSRFDTHRAADELPLDGVSVGYFGHFDPAYARNRVLIKALRRAGATVVPISDRHRFLSRTPRLARSATSTALDVIIVGFPGHSDVGAAKLVALAKSVPVIFNTLTSLWETGVDRRDLALFSARGVRYRLTDWLSCTLASSVWLDTQTHIDWYANEFRIPAGKFRRVWVGADDEVMMPNGDKRSEKFTVFFYGTFIPLQGIEHIVEAAAIVGSKTQEIQFVLCGDGQTHDEMRRLANRLGVRNLEFLPRRPPAELSRLIAGSDVCLGIFGGGEKTQRVIPNKVFDALACGRPVITADTPAAREALVHGEHAWLCPTANPEALAAAILESREDDSARERIAQAGYDLFKRQFSIGALARDLPPLVREVLHG
jgi:glycosyltransferase involved in cell wall biosynthesis